MVKRYYIEFKTWATGKFDVPWPFSCYEEVPDYRLNYDLMVKASDAKLKNIFLNMDEAACTKFLSEYTPAMIVGCLIDLENANDAESNIKRVFGSCEIVGICEVTSNNNDIIQKNMSSARIKSSAAMT